MNWRTTVVAWLLAWSVTLTSLKYKNAYIHVLMQNRIIRFSFSLDYHTSCEDSSDERE